MAKLLSWDEMPQSVRDFDANISKNLASCESKANELSVMVNEILVLLKDADTTLKEDFKDDPQCVDAEKKLALIYKGYQVVKTSIDSDLIAGIIGMGKEVQETIDEIRSKMSEGASWKEASEEYDKDGNKEVKENDQAKIDAANKLIQKLSDCAVAEIDAIKSAQSAVKLGISLDTLKSGELGKYINFSTTFKKASFLLNYEGMSFDFERILDPEEDVIEVEDSGEDEQDEENESIFDKLADLVKKVIENAKDSISSVFNDVSDWSLSDSVSSIKDWITDLAITTTFPVISGISQIYDGLVDDSSKKINFNQTVKDVVSSVIETSKEENIFEFAKDFWGGVISKVGEAGSDVVETVKNYVKNYTIGKVTQSVTSGVGEAVQKVTTLGDDITSGISSVLGNDSSTYAGSSAVEILKNELLGVDSGSLLSAYNALTELLFKDN